MVLVKLFLFDASDIFWCWWHFLVFHSSVSPERGLVFIYEQQNIISQFHAKYFLSKPKYYISKPKYYLTKPKPYLSKQKIYYSILHKTWSPKTKTLSLNSTQNTTSQKQSIISQFHAKYYLSTLKYCLLILHKTLSLKTKTLSLNSKQNTFSEYQNTNTFYNSKKTDHSFWWLPLFSRLPVQVIEHNIYLHDMVLGEILRWAVSKYHLLFNLTPQLHYSAFTQLLSALFVLNSISSKGFKN